MSDQEQHDDMRGRDRLVEHQGEIIGIAKRKGLDPAPLSMPVEELLSNAHDIGNVIAGDAWRQGKGKDDAAAVPGHAIRDVADAIGREVTRQVIEGAQNNE